MNLGELREAFVKLSGRYDLVSSPTTFADDGANNYLTEALKYLDRQLDVDQMWAKLFSTLAASGWYILFERCRAVFQVWASNATDKWELDIVELDDLKNLYLEPWGSVTTGQVSYCSPAVLRTSPETAGTITLDSFGGTAVADATKDEYTYDALIISPPSDEAVEVEVHGLFYSPALTADADENYWSVNHSQLVLWSAMRQLEISYRNTEGRKDWESAIDKEIMDIDKDAVMQQIYNLDQIGG